MVTTRSSGESPKAGLDKNIFKKRERDQPATPPHSSSRLRVLHGKPISPNAAYPDAPRYDRDPAEWFLHITREKAQELGAEVFTLDLVAPDPKTVKVLACVFDWDNLLLDIERRKDKFVELIGGRDNFNKFMVINDGLMLSKDADSHQLAVFREQHGQFSRAPLQKMMSIVSCFLQGRPMFMTRKLKLLLKAAGMGPLLVELDTLHLMHAYIEQYSRLVQRTRCHGSSDHHRGNPVKPELRLSFTNTPLLEAEPGKMPPASALQWSTRGSLKLNKAGNKSHAQLILIIITLNIPINICLVIIVFIFIWAARNNGSSNDGLAWFVASPKTPGFGSAIGEGCGAPLGVAVDGELCVGAKNSWEQEAVMVALEEQQQQEQLKKKQQQEQLKKQQQQQGEGTVMMAGA